MSRSMLAAVVVPLFVANGISLVATGPDAGGPLTWMFPSANPAFGPTSVDIPFHFVSQ